MESHPQSLRWLGPGSPEGGPGSRSFFYLVKTNPPTRDEFRSYFEKGLVPASATEHQIALLKGISMWATQEQARALAARMPERYGYIAEVVIPEGVRVIRQGRSRGHHNIYASADDLLRWVVSVAPVAKLRYGR